MKKYKTVVIGAGNIAKIHLKTLSNSERTEAAAVADIQLERAQSLAKLHGVRAYDNYQTMVIEEKPDIAVITLPHHLHKDAAIWCIEQGCHVLIEKPMALNALECDEICQAGEKHGAVVAVGHMQHYFPANRKAKEIVQSGRLGELVMIIDRRHYPYFLPERPEWFLNQAQSGGGIVINLGSHSIDKIQWLTGSYVNRVKGVLTYRGKRGNVEGSANMLLTLESGLSAAVSLCGYEQVPVNETELLFTGGSLKLNGMSSLWMSQGEERTYEEVKLDGMPDPFALQWEELLDAIQFGKELDIDGDYGRTVSAVIDAVYRSHLSGNEEWVEMRQSQFQL